MQRKIDMVAAKYAARGHKVKVLSGTRVAVTDSAAGNTYRVSNTGRVLTGRELAAELAAESEDPNFIGPE